MTMIWASWGEKKSSKLHIGSFLPDFFKEITLYSPDTRHPGSKQVRPLVDAGAHQHAPVGPALDGEPNNDRDN